MSSAVLTSVRDGVFVITLNRPEVKNAIDSDMSLGLIDALGHLDTDDDLRVGVLSGAGEHFCAGMDLKAFAQVGLPTRIDDVFRHGAGKPLIAAVEGVAVGGGLELALIADLLVASSDARFGSPEVKFGLFPGGGALLRLPRHLPRSIVTEMALTGAPLGAEAAHQHGLVARLCPPGQALTTALDLATTIAANAPLGVQAATTLLRRVPGRTEEELWLEQLEMVHAVFESADAKEGAVAFGEKRAPRWTGS
ncbi:MAG TPA: crotonase/enoyl-CoA hydratase family protein [Acidimicrobiales bacterium]